MTQGRTPAAAISTIFSRIWLGRGRPLMNTPPSWLTRPWPAPNTPPSWAAAGKHSSILGFFLYINYIKCATYHIKYTKSNSINIVQGLKIVYNCILYFVFINQAAVMTFLMPLKYNYNAFYNVFTIKEVLSNFVIVVIQMLKSLFYCKRNKMKAIKYTISLQ